MKILLLAFLIHASSNCFSQDSEPEFGLYFGNDFDNDSITILVNGVLVAKNIKLRQTPISPQNLIIIQNSHGIIVMPHRDRKQILKKIPIKGSILKLDIVINNKLRRFTFNLKDGKFLYPEYSFLRIGWSTIRILIINQSKQVPIML